MLRAAMRQPTIYKCIAAVDIEEAADSGVEAYLEGSCAGTIGECAGFVAYVDCVFFGEDSCVLLTGCLGKCHALAP